MEVLKEGASRLERLARIGRIREIYVAVTIVIWARRVRTTWDFSEDAAILDIFETIDEIAK